MTAAIMTPLSQIQISPGSAIRLTGLTWQHYLALLEELGDNRSTRITYRHGMLEIRMPGALHEIINRLLAKIIFTIAEEMGLEINDLGSTTFSRQDLDQGIEPDSCFYIQNAHLIQGLNPNIPENLPPDLAIEVDISSFSRDKMRIYQSIGVPEVWIYRQSYIKIYQLQESRYVEVFNSPTFPAVSVQQLQEWIRHREASNDLSTLREVRRFCRETINSINAARTLKSNGTDND
jgi:Uma2 family endonuclease